MAAACLPHSHGRAGGRPAPAGASRHVEDGDEGLPGQHGAAGQRAEHGQEAERGVGRPPRQQHIVVPLCRGGWVGAAAWSPPACVRLGAAVAAAAAPRAPAFCAGTRSVRVGRCAACSSVPASSSSGASWRFLCPPKMQQLAQRPIATARPCFVSGHGRHGTTAPVFNWEVCVWEVGMCMGGRSVPVPTPSLSASEKGAWLIVDCS